MKILIISYSQTGQLDNIVTKCTTGITNADIDRISYKTKKKFEFPWTSQEFFDVMPECVAETAFDLEDIDYKHNSYDLIIFGYQPWFLSPSIPTNSILQDKTFLALLKNTPVITIIGSRNMWIGSQRSIDKRISNAGGKIVGNIPFLDRHNNYISAFTIVHWLIKGEKNRKMNIFPMPGVSEKDINDAVMYSDPINTAIQENDFSNLQSRILEFGRISIPTSILLIETNGKKLFKIWLKIITNLGTTPQKRKIWINVYKYYLFTVLFVVAPIVTPIYVLIVNIFQHKKIQNKKTAICNNNF